MWPSGQVVFPFSALMHQSNNVDSSRCYQCVKFLVTLAQKWVNCMCSLLSLFWSLSAGFWKSLRYGIHWQNSLSGHWWFSQPELSHRTKSLYVFWPGVLLLKTTSRSCLDTGAGQCSGCRKRQDALLNKPVFLLGYILHCVRYSPLDFSPIIADVRALLDTSEQRV